MSGDRIGRYRVLRTLGVGGMGEVFLAERADTEFEQLVAIKVVHGGAQSRAVHSRLRIERQILAQLDHPNIAHLLDGGSLPDGTTYIVMEYVD
ncbi:MAG TPA: protein kinase, partial [Steroidobacteraceae bacterium]|nr:protein kinase [Steroidobacteraceae bacterium]